MPFYGGHWSESTRATTYPTHAELRQAINSYARESNRPPVIGNKSFTYKWWLLLVLVVPCFIIFVVSYFAAIGPQMHSACFLRVRSVPLSDSQGFDICFGLHGYHDHVGGVTTSKHGYNIMEVLKNATKYSDLDMSWGPVTRGFAMTPFYIVCLFLYICLLLADCFEFVFFAHLLLMLINIVPVAINLAVFIGVRKTLMAQIKAGSGNVSDVKVSQVGVLAWMQLVALIAFWSGIYWAKLIWDGEPIFLQREVELDSPPAQRGFPPTADNHAFPYYFHTATGLDVASPVTPPRSVYWPDGSTVHPRDV